MNRPLKTTNRSRIRTSGVLGLAACLVPLVSVPSTARADIGLELRASSDRVPPGDTIEIGLYAVSENPSGNQLLAAAVVLFSWDPAYLKLLGYHTDGAEPMSSGSGFPAGDRSHLNEVVPPQDGNGLFQGLAQLGRPVETTPAGTLLMTLQFQTLRWTTGTDVEILELAGDPLAGTIVYDGRVPNKNVTGFLHGATVSIMDCANSTDCNGNGVGDVCDIADGTSRDCNGNGVPDDCDIAFGANGDCDGNQIPDECDPAMTISNCSDIVVQANTSFGMTVDFPMPIVQHGCHPVVTASPPPGTLFTTGTTLVTVTAKDASNRIETCTFTVTVQPAAAQAPPGEAALPVPVPMPGPTAPSGGFCGMGSAAMMPFMLLGWGWVRRRGRR